MLETEYGGWPILPAFASHNHYPGGGMNTAAPLTRFVPLSLHTLALRGSVWTFVGYGASQALRLGSHLILARLLFPEVFGLMALVHVFVQGLQMFSDIGIGPSIIQNRRGEDRQFLNTAWSLQIIRGFVLFGVASIAAWPFAYLYGQPEVGPLIAVASTSALVAGFNSTGIFAANRNLAIGRITMLELFSQAVAVTVMITWAYLYPTVWALVAGAVVAATMKMLLSHLLWDGRDRIGWDPAAARSLIQFGKWIFAASAVNFLAQQGNRLLLGWYLVMSELGIYAVAYHLADSARGVVSRLTHAVMFPAFSRTFRDNPARVRHVYYKARLVSDSLLLPGVGLIAATGPLIIAVLYDSRYHDAGWMLQILSLRVGVSCMTLFGGSCLLAAGNPRYALVTNTIQIIWIFTGVPLVWPEFGLYGAVWVIATANIPAALVIFAGLHRYGVLLARRELLAVVMFGAGYGIGQLLYPYLTLFTGTLQ